MIRNKPLAGVLSCFILSACRPPAPEPPRPEEAAPATAVPEICNEPVFAPYTGRPELDDESAREIILRHYQQHGHELDSGGTAMIWACVDADGRVRAARVKDSSGSEAVDRVARAAVLEMQFRPALNRGEPVAVWIVQPVTFSIRTLYRPNDSSGPR